MSETPCKEWTGCKNRGGYGMKGFSINGKFVLKRVHRLEWEKHYGPIPPEIKVCHRCDNRACYEITHLYLGTQQDNMTDMMNKNRGNWAKGEEHGLSKLTPEQVQSIRQQLKLGITKVSLAKKFNVSHMSIHSIAVGRTWGWLTA